MSLTKYIAVLEVLADSPTGATIGRIQKMNIFLTRGQIERTMRDLIGEGFVRVEKRPYRPNIEAKIYHIEEKAIEYCELIVTKYDRHEKVRPLPGLEEGAFPQYDLQAVVS